MSSYLDFADTEQRDIDRAIELGNVFIKQIRLQLTWLKQVKKQTKRLAAAKQISQHDAIGKTSSRDKQK
jgi:hypothetical protein